IHDGAERRLNLLMPRHPEAIRRLTEIRDVVATLVAGEVSRGWWEDEVEKAVDNALGEGKAVARPGASAEGRFAPAGTAPAGAPGQPQAAGRPRPAEQGPRAQPAAVTAAAQAAQAAAAAKSAPQRPPGQAPGAAHRPGAPHAPAPGPAPPAPRPPA